MINGKVKSVWLSNVTKQLEEARIKHLRALVSVLCHMSPEQCKQRTTIEQDQKVYRCDVLMPDAFDTHLT